MPNIINTLFPLIVFISGMTPVITQAEQTLESKIQQLMLTIETSQCHFIRNNKHYSPEQSIAHVQKKYTHFKADIDTIDRFIELSASKSLISGKPYYVKCGTAEPIVAATWLSQKSRQLGLN